MDIGEVYDAVWRTDFSAAGFYLRDLGHCVDSHSLRRQMIALKHGLSKMAVARTGKRFVGLSLGRFDQQTTTKFHLDGAPAESLLMLGYEPSEVQSRLALADYTRSAFERGVGPREFLERFNPMFAAGEEALNGYVTELPQPAAGHSRILLINNSSLPFTAARTNPLGVMHRAEIIDPDDRKRRIVNSIMMTTALDQFDTPAIDELAREQEFIATEQISPKIYT